MDGTVYRLSKRRVAVKASATRNANKAKEIYARKGVEQYYGRRRSGFTTPSKDRRRVVTEELIQLQTGQGYEQAATEEWLEGFRRKSKRH